MLDLKVSIIGQYPFSRSVSFPTAAIFISVLAVVGAAFLFWVQNSTDIRFVFDPYDLNVYFASSRWVTESGRLYYEVESEYPPLANLIFAAFRYLGAIINPSRETFKIVWMLSALFVYVVAVYRVAKGTTALAVFAWLAPAALYFALLRYDIFPAVATLGAMFAIRRCAYYTGAIWLGVAVALKGYALFLLPAYCVFITHRRGLLASIKVGALAVAPMLLCLLATFAFAGWEGLTFPFKFHAQRLLNGESTYDAINYLLGAEIPSMPEVRSIGQVLQIGCALAAAAMRPRNFNELVNAFLFAILGFISFSVFHSPQYVLWILPIACFSDSRALLVLSIAFGWLTYFYFPICFDLEDSYPRIFESSIIAITSLRFVMMFLAVRDNWSKRGRTETYWMSPR